MFNRRQTYTLIGEDNKTRPYDLSVYTADFDGAGVHFLIHVIIKESVTIWHVTKGKDDKPIRTPEVKEFLKPVLLAEEQSKENLSGVSPDRHPDQLYLESVPSTLTETLKTKEIVRVEIDDSIELCDTAMFGSCSVVIPKWCKDRLGDVPTMIFVHRSDRHTTTKKYAYDLQKGREDYHEAWQWDDTAPGNTLAHTPQVQKAVVYVFEFRCESAKCGKKPRRPTLLVAFDKPSATKQDVQNAMDKLGNCQACQQKTWAHITDFGKPRIKKAAEVPVA